MFQATTALQRRQSTAEEGAPRDDSAAETEPDPQHAAEEGGNPNVSKTKAVSKTKTGKIVILFSILSRANSVSQASINAQAAARTG